MKKNPFGLRILPVIAVISGLALALLLLTVPTVRTDNDAQATFNLSAIIFSIGIVTAGSIIVNEKCKPKE